MAPCRAATRRRGPRTVVLGGALGQAFAVVATLLLGELQFEVDGLDPLTFLGVPLLLGVPAYLPARGASRVHPATALWTDCRRASHHRQ